MKRATRHTIFTTVLLPLVLAGCASLPMTGSLPPGTTVTRLASLDHDSPVAWDGTGTHIAYNRDGIRTVSVVTGETTRISTGIAVELAWSPDGRFAAAFPDGPRSRIALFGRAGTVIGYTRVDGHVGRLVWKRSGELLITTSELRTYSFGGNVIVRLYSWNGTDTPRETILANVTLKRSTLPLWNKAYRGGADMELSPLQDEIVFARIIDPPMYPPYLRIVLHHLETGAERDIANLPLSSAVPVFTPDGDHLLSADGTAEGRQVETAEVAAPPNLPYAATTITLSPGGSSRFIAGHLILRDRSAMTFPADCRGIFSPTGTSLALIRNDTLYLVSGLPEDHVRTLSSADRDRLLYLRKLRSERLITNQDYLQQKEKVLNP